MFQMHPHLYAPCRELYADRGFRLEVKLIPSESRKQVRLPNSGVSDQHNCVARGESKGNEVNSEHSESADRRKNTIGDTVIYGKYGGSDIEVDGQEMKILREGDILAKLL